MTSNPNCGQCGYVCPGECVAGACRRATLDEAVAQLACTDGGVVAEISSSVTSQTRFMRLPLTGGAPALVLDAGRVVGMGTMERFVVADHDIYFFGNDGGAEGSLYHGVVGGGPPTVIVPKLVRPRWLAVTKDNLVFQNGDWTAPDATKAPRYATSLSVAPRQGGTAKELFRAFVGDTASDGHYVYVGAVDQGVIRVDPKTGERNVLTDRRASKIVVVDGQVVFQSLHKIVDVASAGGAVTELLSVPDDVSTTAFNATSVVYVKSATKRDDPQQKKMIISYDGKLVEQRSDGRSFDLRSGVAELDAKLVTCNGEVFFAWGGSDEVWSARMR